MQKEDNMAEVSEKALAFVEKNKAQRRQRKNILRPFEADIMFLKRKGFGAKEILQFLKEEHEIDVALSTLNSFFSKIKKRESESKAVEHVENKLKPVSTTSTDTDDPLITSPFGNLHRSELY